MPEKDVTQVTTNVMVRDGATVIIGGLMREDLTTNTTQIPALGKLAGGRLAVSPETEETQRTRNPRADHAPYHLRRGSLRGGLQGSRRLPSAASHLRRSNEPARQAAHRTPILPPGATQPGPTAIKPARCDSSTCRFISIPSAGRHRIAQRHPDGQSFRRAYGGEISPSPAAEQPLDGQVVPPWVLERSATSGRTASRDAAAGRSIRSIRACRVEHADRTPPLFRVAMIRNAPVFVCGPLGGFRLPGSVQEPTYSPAGVAKRGRESISPC